MRIDGAEGSRSNKRHMNTSEDIMRCGTPLSTPKRRTGIHEKLYIVAPKIHHQ